MLSEELLLIEQERNGMDLVKVDAFIRKTREKIHGPLFASAPREDIWCWELRFIEAQIMAGRREKRFGEEAVKVQTKLVAAIEEGSMDQLFTEAVTARRVVNIHMVLGLMEEAVQLLSGFEVLQNRMLEQAFEMLQMDAFCDQYHDMNGCGFSSHSRWVKGLCLLNLKREDEAIKCFVEAQKMEINQEELVDLKGRGQLCYGCHPNFEGLVEIAKREFEKLAVSSKSTIVLAAAASIVHRIDLDDDDDDDYDERAIEEKRAPIVSQASNMKRECSFCGKDGAKFKCSGCLASRYCNSTCQKEHWAVHKPACRKKNQN